MKKIILSLFIVFFIKDINLAQNNIFNLKNIDNVSVHFVDKTNELSSTFKQKIVTETKIKLKSLGINLANTKDSLSTKFTIRCDVIKSNFASHRILLEIMIFEDVTTSRNENIRTKAITYFDRKFFKGKNMEATVYSIYMDKMIVNFIENYL